MEKHLRVPKHAPHYNFLRGLGVEGFRGLLTWNDVGIRPASPLGFGV